MVSKGRIILRAAQCHVTHDLLRNEGRREGAAQTGAPHHMHYAAAKASLVNLAKSFAQELAPHIRVNCVTHGLTLTGVTIDINGDRNLR